MHDLPSTLDLLNQLMTRMLKVENDRRDLLQTNLPQAMKDEQDKLAQQQILKLREYQESLLHGLVQFPPHKVEHFNDLTHFHQTSPFEKSVFVMTKFPGNASPIDDQLRRVIQAVRVAIDGCGYRSHLASDKNYNPLLWKNVEFYLLACGKGIAIVESQHTSELNPNVTMEWGWMRATNRQVLFLVEKSFDKGRADLSGLIQEPFDWDNPETDIEAAVRKFLI
ncbi:hypothetical protein RBB77_21545 [Tunturibacter psychrotolerans]|uniref:Uncharacterized protein n=1 Tax=Tunturiibacter psychrotolerans TaxID=3069686 RepID=A0AAU7ZPS9_9BACT